MPVDYLDQTPRTHCWIRCAKDGAIHFLELPPGVRRVLEFDFNNDANCTVCIEEHDVWLAPPSPAPVLELEPWARKEAQVSAAEHALSDVFLHLLLVAHACSFGATRLMIAHPDGTLTLSSPLDFDGWLQPALIAHVPPQCESRPLGPAVETRAVVAPRGLL